MRSVLLSLLCSLTLLVAACGTQPPMPFVQTVDDSSGESFTRSREPLRMLAPRPALSRVGKDYLFVAPVSVAGLGTPQNYLWFGFGSSLDRRLTGAPLPNVNAIVLVVDDVPMTFDIVHWSDIASSEPFDLDVESYESFGAKITRSQLRRISSASKLSAFVTNLEHRSPIYAMSEGEYADWSSL